MKKGFKKYAIVSASVFFVALFAVGAFAMPGFFGHPKNGPGPWQNNASIAINNAISGNDFNAFQDAVTAYGIKRFENTTQEQFNALVTTYQNRIQLQAELNQTRQDINNAIKNNDYASWKQAMTDWFNKMTSQDMFSRAVARYDNQTNKTKMGWNIGRMPRLGYATFMPHHMRRW